MKKISKIFSSILLVLLIFTFLPITSFAANTEYSSTEKVAKNKKEYIQDIAYNLSCMNNNFYVYTDFRPKFTDASIPDILRSSREYDSAAAGTLAHMTVKQTISTDKGYRTEFEVRYDITKATYLEMKNWALTEYAPKVAGKSTYDKIKETYKFMIDKCEPDVEEINVHSLFKNGRGNQKCYAILLSILMNSCDIECDYVYDDGYHYNVIEIDGYTYNTNAYLEDKKGTRDNYFLKGRRDWDGHGGKYASSPNNYNPENPGLTKFLNFVYYGILYVGWPLSIGAFAFILIKKKKTKS